MTGESRHEFEWIEPRLKSQAARESLARLDTIHWVANLAIVSTTRYREILRDPATFKAVYPGLAFENPTINHVVDGSGVVMTTSKKEILNEQNFALFRGHQIVQALVSMTGILEHFLKTTAASTGVQQRPREPAIDYFERATQIRIADFDERERLQEFWNVRHIAVHNLSRMDVKFRQRTGRGEGADTPYVFFPTHTKEYRDIGGRLLFFIDEKLASRG